MGYLGMDHHPAPNGPLLQLGKQGKRWMREVGSRRVSESTHLRSPEREQDTKCEPEQKKQPARWLKLALLECRRSLTYATACPGCTMSVRGPAFPSLSQLAARSRRMRDWAKSASSPKTCKTEELPSNLDGRSNGELSSTARVSGSFREFEVHSTSGDIGGAGWTRLMR